MDLEAETARFGVKTIEDLAWKDLLDGFTCTECGRCQDACPAWATGKPLNPKTHDHGPARDGGRCGGRRAADPVDPAEADPAACRRGSTRPIVDTAIPYDAVWDCVTCGACVEACPVLIEHVDKIVGLRRNLVLEESRFPAELTGAIQRHGALRQPVGTAGERAAGLDEGPAVHGADRGGRRGRGSRRGRGA